MTYQDLNTTVDLKKIKFRYTLAKWLTTGSMAAVVLMAMYSLFYPVLQSKLKLHLVTDGNITSNNDSSSPINFNRRNTTCKFGGNNMIVSSDDSYTPPSPDDTLWQALDYVSDDDFNNYCDRRDLIYGFSDDLHLDDQNCGNWQQDFSRLQQHRLQQLDQLKSWGGLKNKSISKDDIPPFVSYVCQEDPKHRGSHSCGGLADRMSGMISTFFFALLTNRGYLMNWQKGDPTPLESVFEKPVINWSFNPKEMKQLYNTGSQGFQSVNTLNFNWEKIRGAMFPDGPTQDFNELWPAKYVEVKSNRGYIIRTFDHSTRYTDQLNDMGMTKTNSFRCILDYLLRPTSGSRQFINAYKEFFKWTAYSALVFKYERTTRRWLILRTT
ncbi:unnamed protein product [Absidia cylindrospora]